MTKRIPPLRPVVVAIGLALASTSLFAATAKNVVLMIGDGMGPTQVGAARIFGQRVLHRQLNLLELGREGRTALVLNDTADAIVTESAAAASQIATGVRSGVRVISTASDGKTPLPTILECAKRAGKAAGLVTGSRITDATPAAFSAHVPDRYQEASIAAQQLALPVDILLGGGRRSFIPESAGGARKDERDLLAEARQAGYQVVQAASDLDSASGTKLLGLFASTEMSFEIDRAAEQPSLAQMTSKTIEILAGNRKGFFLMVEGGRIDHAAHLNDAAATIREVLAFDDAVGVVREFQRRHPDTLVIVTADHETGGMALIGNSKDSKLYVGMDVEAIGRAKSSFEVMMRELEANATPERVKSQVAQDLGVDLTETEIQTVIDDPIHRMDPTNYPYPLIHSLAFVLRPYYRVGWASQTHTASPLFAFALGPGSERMAGVLHNTELFRLMARALDLKVPSP